MTRGDRALRGPDARHDWSSFPAETTDSESVFRAHSIHHGPWFFASGKGRFDLLDPDGTCYFGDDVEVAVREKIGPTYSQLGAVPESVAAQFSVSELELRPGLRLADIDDRASAAFSVTNELTTTDDYALAQEWAAVFHLAGFAGIRYRARFTPDKSSNARALFGSAGPRDGAVTSTIDGASACRQAGFTVLERPSSTELTMARPPALGGRDEG